jgi:uncharacterized protein YmfQ (DUF2313 family)
MSVFDKILSLSKQLFPTGRAFRIPVDSYFENLLKGLVLSEERFFNDAKSVIDSTFPDNANFSTQDAAIMEKRLGLITNTSVSLSDRKKAIIRKLNFPGTIKARQARTYLEAELQKAGFNVYVYENRFDDGMGGYTTKTPLQVAGSGVITKQRHGQRRHGQIRHGSLFTHKVVNHLEENLDAIFDTGSNLDSTFFVGGTPLGTIANVPAAREKEFRQLILKIKPTQTVAFLFINFT